MTIIFSLKMTFVDSFALLSSRVFYNCKYFIRRKFLYKSGLFHMDIRHEATTTMEVINEPRIVSVYRQAVRTFDDKNKSDMDSNFDTLKTIVDALRAEDLGFDKIFNNTKFWAMPNKAPCTYIEVFQNNEINMSIFALQPGFKMPLHDHPQMHGLLKVITGAVNIRAYTEYPLQEAVNFIDFQTQAKLEAARIAQGKHKKRRLFAEITTDQICSDSSDSCVLTPTLSNYHEIEALDKPAAFFDILSPPYDTLIEGVGPRRCRYYHVGNAISTNLVELQENDAPHCFFCDQAPYSGPALG